MSEADAKFWYKSHLVLQCDFCELIYNEHDILDKHIFAAHQGAEFVVPFSSRSLTLALTLKLSTFLSENIII